MDAQKFHAMPRPALTSPYVEARQAASVIMVRQAGSTMEVYVQHRATTMDFAAGVLVFPGGRTEIDDASFDFGEDSRTIIAQHALGWQQTSLGSTDSAASLVNSSMMLRTGLREVEEETGAAMTPAVMRPWANLITPVGYPKRFDTFFYLATPGDDVVPENITTEATAAEWLTIDAILRDDAEHRIELMRPTKFLLLDLIEYGSIADFEARDPVVQPIRGL